MTSHYYSEESGTGTKAPSGFTEGKDMEFAVMVAWSRYSYCAFLPGSTHSSSSRGGFSPLM